MCVTIQWKKDVVIWTNANIVKYVSHCILLLILSDLGSDKLLFLKRVSFIEECVCVCISKDEIYGIFSCNNVEWIFYCEKHVL